MRFLYLLVFALLPLALTAQPTTTVNVIAPGCKAMNLYAFNGVTFAKTGTFEAAEDGSFSLTDTFEEPVFRYVGPSPRDVFPFVIGADEQLTVSATCGKLKNAKVTASPINVRYAELKQLFGKNNTTYSVTMRAFNKASRAGDTETAARETATLVQLDNEKKELLEQTKKDFPLLARVVSLNTYLSFVADNNDRFESELDYFVNTYFQFVDHEDEGYGDLPWTYEGNRNYARTLAAAVPGEQLAQILNQVYARWPQGSRARFFAMNGGLASLMQKKHAAALPLADLIVEQYKGIYPELVASVEQQSAGLRTFAVGAEAPDFEGPTPEGASVSLSSLRGKVVLIDFWASWCGPCRRENPNVVKLYDKYKAQGFEILGVSLDKTKARWQQAIAADKLTWLHISDLAGWKSKYAKQYGVSSIPQTVLVDAQGKILARNLRGAALEHKLAEVFSGK